MVTIAASIEGLIYGNVPSCAVAGLKVGAGLGSVAGAVGGVAAAGGTATFATCPTLAITTLMGTGMLGPAAPLLALITGAVLGGVAGGTAGGVYTCKTVGRHYVIKYTNPHHYEVGHSYPHAESALHFLPEYHHIPHSHPFLHLK